MNEKICNTMAPIKIPQEFEPKNVRMKEFFTSLTASTSVIEQQKILKDLSLLAESTDDENFVAHLVGYIFLIIDSKHPLKKTVTRILLTMEEERVTSSMAIQILSLISECECDNTFFMLTKENDILLNLSSCFNNFAPGVEALSKIINLVFVFACNNFIKSVTSLYLENEFDKHKLHIYIYNSSKFLVALLNQCDISHHISEFSSKLLLASYKVITDDHINFNTKANCGILLIMAAIHIPENDEKSGGLATILSIECAGGDSLLGNTLLLSKNYTAKICIFSGILNTVPHEVICADKLDDVAAPIYIFQSLLESASKRTGKPLEIMEISRTFILLSRLLFNMDNTDIDVIFKPALDYVWTHLDHFIDTVRHDTITVLKNFVKIAVNEKKEGDEKLINYIVEYISNLLDNNTTNYKALNIISNETTCEYLLERFPNLPNRLLANLKNNSIAQQVCSAYESLMEQYSAEQPEKWIDVWVKDMVPLINKCESVTYTYYQKIFTTAFKINELVIKLLSYGHRTFDNPNELGVLLSCFISARKTNTSINFYSDDVSGTLWNGMLEYDLLDILMCHQIPEIRISTLTLIIECQKTTEIFPAWDLRFLINFLRYNITAQLPNIRQQIVALYKKAFTRYKESLYVIKRTIKSLMKKVKTVGKLEGQLEKELTLFIDKEIYYKQFIKSMFENVLVKGLHSDVNYSRRSISLELLLFLKTCADADGILNLWTKENVILLYQALDDSYESNIIMATKLLLELPKNIIYYHNKTQLKNDLKKCIALASSIKPTNTTTAAYTLQVLKNSPIAQEVLCEIQNISKLTKYADHTSLLLLNYIIIEFEKGLEVAKDNVLIASKYAPTYGLIFCIRHLIQKEHFEEEYPIIVPKIIELCGRISAIVSPIVNNSSPEGYMPTDNDQITDETVTSQMILVYAWRTIKEISLLLGELSFTNCKDEQIIPSKHLGDIADYFMTLFMETKHRGAYEQAYLGFSKFCQKLWNSKIGNYSEWPVNWLNTILDVLEGKKDNFSKICSTRRSAGVPFIIQAIVSTELQTRGHESFNHCMNILLAIAGNVAPENEKAATHAMNILRALYKHNQLGELVAPYVAKGVMIAITEFSNPVWGVRNSATLMFSALMMRIFGVQRTKDGEEISIKNRMSAKVFFMRYPELYDFILDKLKLYSNDSSNTSLYPLLFILARLYSSADKTEMLLYLPYINSCLGSAIYKMRELAAQASISAMPTDDYSIYINSLFRNLNTSFSQNLLHGSLLQLKLLIKNISKTTNVDLDFPNLINQSFWVIEHVGIKVPHMTSTLYMEILILITSRFKEKCYKHVIFPKLMSFILDSLDINSDQVSTAKNSFELTKITLFMHLFLYILDLPTICREKFFKDILMAALYSTNEDIQVFALNCLKYLFETNFHAQNVCILEEDESERSTLEYNLIKPISDDMKLLLISAITVDLGCYNIFTDLFHILKTRSKRYSKKVCLILPYFPCTINRIRPKNVPVILDKQVILDFLICECIRYDSDMFAAILPIISTLVNETKQKLHYTPFIQQILKPFSSPENTLEERMAVCNFLLQNPKFLHDSNVLTTADIVEIWYIVITLLQDNDCLVRDGISRITNFIQSPISTFVRRFILGMFVIAEKSLEELLQYMPELIPLEEAMKIYLILALKPKKQSKPSNSDSGEVFDQGELNTYEEGDIISILASKCLKQCLWKLEDDLSYSDNSIFVEEHTLLVATKLFNLFYGHHLFYTRSEDKLLSMLVLKEITNYLEMRSVHTGDFKKDFSNVLEKKFMSIFSQSPNMFQYCRVESFFKFIFTFED